MTLGSIFEKLGVIKVASILKWYGIVVVSTVVVVVALFLIGAAGLLLWEFVKAAGFWGTLTMFLLVTGFACVKYFEDEIFPGHDDDFGYDAYLHDSVGMQAKMKGRSEPYNFVNNAENEQEVESWRQIRKLVEILPHSQACNIVVDDKEYRFKNRQDALDFLDGKIGSAKTE